MESGNVNTPFLVHTALRVEMNDAKLSLSDNRAIDAQGNLWLKVDVLDDKNRKRSGWVLVNGEGAKRVSCWDWFDFMQIKETATLKELYLDADKSLKRNKDNHSLSQYKPTIKETLSILDKQYHVETKIYTSIKEASFKGIADKPMLFTALSRLLINYESEWYSEIDAESKMPKWEALNSELTENAKNVLTYLKEADEAKCDIYVNTLAADEQKSVKKGLEELRRSIARFPADYIDSPTEKLSKGQLDIYFLLKQLEKQVTAWEKTKEKIKKMLWWDDVAKGLAKLNQPKNTPPENGETTNTTTTPTDSAPLATLSADGRAWFIHPVAMVGYFNIKSIGIVTYHIYHDGNIEKHIPQEILKGYEQKYKYVYHDKNNSEHEICIVGWHTINKKKFEKKPRGTFKYPDHGRVSETKTNVSDGYIVAKAKYENGDIHEWIKKEKGVSIYERLTMANGDIAEYGTHDRDGIVWRLYKKQQEEAQLVRMPDSINYESNGVVIKYELKETYRKYTNSDILAGFIGALAEIKENITVTGSAYEQGSCFPSALHINGQSIDTKYIKKDRNLSDWKKDKAFVNALAKFHFRTFRIGDTIYKSFRGISGVVNGGTLHDSHLHTENFDFNAIKVIE
jgi:hypothetical protein